MALEVVGKLVNRLDKQSGTAKSSGKEWVKQTFVVRTDEEYNNLYPFEVFGQDKVDALSKISIGSEVKVSFNVSAREYQGKYYTNLSAWRLVSVDGSLPQPSSVSSVEDDLPF